jgi:hypothetical protein
MVETLIKEFCSDANILSNIYKINTSLVVFSLRSNILGPAIGSSFPVRLQQFIQVMERQ